MGEAGERVLALILGGVAGLPLPWVGISTMRVLGLERMNFAGKPIATAAGLLLLLPLLPVFWLGGIATAPLATALLGFAFLGLLDDRWGTSEFKGMRGHLRALRSGRVTTGLIKASGGLALSLVLAAWLRPWGELPIAALLLALTANAFNLLDLRPLRTLKVFWLAGMPLIAGLPHPQALSLAMLAGLTVPYAPLEARRAVMLGDTGSNALGAAVGVGLVQLLPWWAQALVAALLVLLHTWAEKHSLTAWIESRPVLRRLDELGWRENYRN